MEQHKKTKTNHRTGLRNFIKKPLFWSAFILLLAAFFFISSIDLGSIIKIDAQTAIVGEGTAHYLARWIPSGEVPTSTPTLVVTPSSATKQIAQTQQYTATYDPDGTGPQASQNVSATAVWSSASASIATVDSTGLATAVAVGTTQIQAVYSGLTDSGDITVQQPVNNPPTISEPNGTISSGTMASLTSDCKISDGLTLGWTFSDTDGDTQLAFRIQVSKDPNFVITPYDFDSNNVTSTASTYKIDTLPSGVYYWRIMVWDEHNLASSWIEAVASQTITANKVVDFSTSPTSATINQNITFIPSFGAGILAQIASQIWSFPQGLPTSWNNSAVNPVVKFSSVGTKTNTLNITAIEGQTCAVIKDLVIGGGGEI